MPQKKCISRYSHWILAISGKHELDRNINIDTIFGFSLKYNFNDNSCNIFKMKKTIYFKSL